MKMPAIRESGSVKRVMDRRELQMFLRQAILGEVYTTPKPGLVDLQDNGAHKDMNVMTFERSARAILPALADMFEAGCEKETDPQSLFAQIRIIGLGAEQAMYRATGGVNTHKGLIFTMGILAAAAGRCLRDTGSFQTDRILALSARMTDDAICREFQTIALREPRTKGEQLYQKYREEGIRGEARRGFPVLGRLALPMMRSLTESGAGRNQINLCVLLIIMTGINDTNVWSRSSGREVRWIRERAREILKMGGALSEQGMEALRQMNRECIAKNISPGGAADLLAACLFLYGLEQISKEMGEAGSVRKQGVIIYDISG